MKKKNCKSVLQLTDKQRKLVEKYIPFAINLGNKHAGLGKHVGIPVEDLQQEACYGLCVAATRFCPTQGVDFSVYAANWCKKYILRAIRKEVLTEEKDVTDIPVKILDENMERKLLQEKVNSMMSTLDEKETLVISSLYGIYSDPKDFQEIAIEMNLTRTRVHQIYNNAMAKMELNYSNF